MELTEFEKRFLQNWKILDFTEWNEQDVREDFIAGLLKILGYSKGTVNDIIREPTLALSEKYHRIGRKQVNIDYVPTTRLKKFWIIEAKPGKSKAMDFGDYLQAHLYAIHPEINARYIVVTNGWEIRIYDAALSNSWEDYLLLINQENCEDKYAELKEYLSARSLTKKLRSHVLDLLSESLKIELDVNEAETFKKEVFKIYSDAVPIIRNNAEEFQRLSFEKNKKEADEWIKSISFRELLVWMDRPTDAIPWYAKECFRRMSEAQQQERDEMLRILIMNYRGRPHGVFRVQSLDVMCRLLKDNIEASATGSSASVLNCFEELVESNIRYWSFPVGNVEDHIGFALCHLDNTCARISYKFVRRFGMEVFNKIVEQKKNNFAIEELLLERPSTADEVINSVRIVNELLWNRLSHLDSPEIWKRIWDLNIVEKRLDEIPQVEYTDGNADLLRFANYGVDFDMLCFGTWSTLQQYKKTLDGFELSEQIKMFMNKTFDEVTLSIPKPLPCPVTYSPSESDLLNSLQ